MKLLTWFTCAFSCVLACADPVSPGTPSVVVNNYLGREYGPAAPAVAAAVPSATIESHSAAEENEGNGLYLGILGGVAKSKAGASLPVAGFAPKIRFGRFFALEGTLVGATTSSEKPKAGFLEASGHFTGQLTFRSALFDFTPKAGIGVTRYGRTGVDGYTGITALVGVEVELGRLVLSAEARGGSSQKRHVVFNTPEYVADPSPYLYGETYYPSYSYDYNYPTYSTETKTFERVEFEAALKTGPRDRAGVRIMATDYDGEQTTSYAFFYRFGF